MTDELQLVACGGWSDASLACTEEVDLQANDNLVYSSFTFTVARPSPPHVEGFYSAFLNTSSLTEIRNA